MKRKAEPKITRDLTIAGKRLVVIDDVLEARAIEWVDRARDFKYGLYDYDTPETEYAMHWKQEVPIDAKIVVSLADVARRVFGDRRLHVAKAHYNLHLYGDLQFPHVDGPRGAVSVFLYANRKWDPLWMGETIFYERRDEPTVAVLPRPGRVVVFEADILHRAGVPHRECFEPRLTLSLKLRRLRRA